MKTTRILKYLLCIVPLTRMYPSSSTAVMIIMPFSPMFQMSTAPPNAVRNARRDAIKSRLADYERILSFSHVNHLSSETIVELERKVERLRRQLSHKRPAQRVPQIPGTWDNGASINNSDVPVAASPPPQPLPTPQPSPPPPPVPLPPAGPPPEFCLVVRCWRLACQNTSYHVIRRHITSKRVKSRQSMSKSRQIPLIVSGSFTRCEPATSRGTH